MCLVLDISKDVNIRRMTIVLNRTNSKGLIEGYKAFRKDFYNNNKIISLYKNFYTWKYRGWNYSKRASNILTADESRSRKIFNGFHSFLNKKDALMEKDWYTDVIIRKVWFKPEHLIAVGVFNQAISMVTTDLYVRFD
jgi:hypothetical protein